MKAINCEYFVKIDDSNLFDLITTHILGIKSMFQQLSSKVENYKITIMRKQLDYLVWCFYIGYCFLDFVIYYIVKYCYYLIDLTCYEYCFVN